jgi:hypothetical protein
MIGPHRKTPQTLLRISQSLINKLDLVHLVMILPFSGSLHILHINDHGIKPCFPVIFHDGSVTPAYRQA